MTKYEMKLENLKKVLAREKGDYIPILAFPGAAICAYSGMTALEAAKDRDSYVEAFTSVFKDMWVDCTIDNGITTLPEVEKAFGRVQYKVGPDDTTIEHLQLSLMNEDEYPQLTADPSAFIKDVLLPRKYPWIYDDTQRAVSAVKVYFDAASKLFFDLGAALEEYTVSECEIIPLTNALYYPMNPVDVLFDSFRGFKGTIMDLRRRPDEVQGALDTLWEVYSGITAQTEIEQVFPYAEQMPHMPAYMSTKQFERFYFPYEKQFVDNYAKYDSKLLILLEGSWKHVIDMFHDVPKDSMIMMADDDDVRDLNRWIGDHHIICGGAKLVALRSGDLEANLDYAKACIDACAPGGGFLFSTDKNWISPGDVNQNMVDVFNFVHEYKQ